MRRLVHSALLLLALAGSLQASFNGMAAATYAVPFDIWDAGGGTATSATYNVHFTLPANLGAPSGGSRFISSIDYRMYPDFLFKLFTQTPTPSATGTLTGTPSATPTYTPTGTLSDTPSATPTATPSDTLTGTPSYTLSDTPSATPTYTPTLTSTDTPSDTPTGTPTDTPTDTLSDTPSATPTATLTQTPYPVISLFKSANTDVINFPGTIVYTLSWFNTGTLDATNVVLTDTISNGQLFQSSSTTPSSHSGQTYVWDIGTVPVNGNGSLTLTVSEQNTDQNASNAFSASGTGFGTVNSNVVNIGFGTAFTVTDSPTDTYSVSPTPTDTPTFTLTSTLTDTLTSTLTDTLTDTPTFTLTSTLTNTLSSTLTATLTSTLTDTLTSTSTDTESATPTSTVSASPSDTWTLSSTPSVTPSVTPTPSDSVTASPSGTPTSSNTGTASATPTVSPTATLTPAPPQLSISLTYQGNDWPGSGYLTYTITFSSLACGNCATAQDLVVTFNSDTQYSGIGANNELNAVNQTCNILTCLGPEDQPNDNQWSEVNNSDSILSTGPFTMAPATAIQRSAYAFVESNHLNVTITSQAVISSAAYGVSATSLPLNIYIYAVQPSPTPFPTAVPPTPTPVAFEGYTAAYPQPAGDNICIAYFAPHGGPLSIEVYNLAFKRVALITDQAQGGRMETACVGISQLAPGVYLYRTKVGDYSFPLNKFGVMR